MNLTAEVRRNLTRAYEGGFTLRTVPLRHALVAVKPEDPKHPAFDILQASSSVGLERTFPDVALFWATLGGHYVHFLPKIAA